MVPILMNGTEAECPLGISVVARRDSSAGKELETAHDRLLCPRLEPKFQIWLANNDH